MEDPSTFAEPCPSLLPAGDNAEMPLIELRRSIVVLGSREDAHLQLKSHTVSRTHAVIVIEPCGAYIHDLASREGVFVNRQQIHDTVIEDGDEIRVGRFEFIFQAGGLPSSAEPSKSPPAAHLRIKGNRFPLAQRVTSLGRRQGMDVILDDEAVSATHALIYAYQGAHIVRDLNSRTGVFVNGKLIARKTELRGGDVIRIGPTTMRYVLDSTLASRPPAIKAADEGMSAAMMEVVVAEEPDTTPTTSADEAAVPSPGSLDEPTAHWDDSGDPDDLLGAPEPAASLHSHGATAVLAPPDRDTTRIEPAPETSAAATVEFRMDGCALDAVQEYIPHLSADAAPPGVKELHHIIVRKHARSTLVIPTAQADRCPARLLTTHDHPLCNAVELVLQPVTVVLDNQSTSNTAPRLERPQRVSSPPVAKTRTAAHRPAAPAPPQKPVKPKPSKYTASGEYRIDFDDEDDDKDDPRAAMQRTAVAFMQDSIIGMPVAEVEAAPDPFTLGDVFKPQGKQLPGLILSYRMASSTSGPNRRPPAIPPRPAGR